MNKLFMSSSLLFSFFKSQFFFTPFHRSNPKVINMKILKKYCDFSLLKSFLAFPQALLSTTITIQTLFIHKDKAGGST